MSRNIKILTTIALIISALLFSFSPAFAQYKLELEWQKKLVNIAQPGISAITKSNNDSLIYVASPNRILTINTTNGETLKIDTVESTYFNFLMSKDGKIVTAAGDWGVGLLDPQTFKRVYWDSIPYGDYRSDFRTLTFNEKQNMIVLCSKSYVGKRETFIRVYDLNTKSLFKEFPPSYFGDIGIKNATITDDGKYVIYGYETYTDQSKQHFFVKMIDMDGKLIKDFGETSSSKFTTTNDGKTLIYFDSKAMHFFDLATMQEIEGIPIGGADPENIEMSSDGNSMIIGYGNGLVYYDLETKKSFYLRDFGTWRIFKLNTSNSKIFGGQSRDLYKFNFVTTSVLDYEKNSPDYILQAINNELFINSTKEISRNLQFRILTLDSKLLIVKSPNGIQITSNKAIIDISNLNSGSYFLQISDSQNVISVLKFLKVD